MSKCRCDHGVGDHICCDGIVSVEISMACQASDCPCDEWGVWHSECIIREKLSKMKLDRIYYGEVL